MTFIRIEGKVQKGAGRRKSPCAFCGHDPQEVKRAYARGFKAQQRTQWEKHGLCIQCGKETQEGKKTCAVCIGNRMVRKSLPKTHHWKAATRSDGRKGFVSCTYCELRVRRDQKPSGDCAKRP